MFLVLLFCHIRNPVCAVTRLLGKQKEWLHQPPGCALSYQQIQLYSVFSDQKTKQKSNLTSTTDEFPTSFVCDKSLDAFQVSISN